MAAAMSFLRYERKDWLVVFLDKLSVHRDQNWNVNLDEYSINEEREKES
jgi:hypothetical protein